MTTNKKAITISKPYRSHHKAKTVPPVKSNQSTKPATILYKKLPDDMILIAGFENFLSLEEIKSKYGDAIMKVYFDFPCHMSRYVDGVRLSGFRTDSIANIEFGQLCNKDTFSQTNYPYQKMRWIAA